MRYIASCSFGKDSLATILLARKHGEPLDEAIYCEVMFDKGISGEVPEHRDFIYTKGIPALERMGVKVTVLRGDKTYVDLFTGQVTRGPKKGLLRSFPVCGKCYVQRDCKLRPIERYQKTLPPDTVHSSVSPRTSRHGCCGFRRARKFPCWRNTTSQNRMPRSSARRQGSFRLSMNLPTGAAVGSAPTPNRGSYATCMTATRTSGAGCWSCRHCRGRCPRNLTENGASLTSMPCSDRRTPAKRLHKRKRSETNEQREV